LKLDPKFKNRLQKLDEEIASWSLFRQWGSSFLKGHYLLRLWKTQEAKDVFLAVIPLRDNDTPKIYIIDTYNTLAEIYKELGDKKAAKKYEQLAKKYRGGNWSK
jgi:tetratricopeptide (TPR) repeat protein